MTQYEMDRVKRAVIRKYPIFASIALFNVPIQEDKTIPTAAVCGGKNDKGEIELRGIKYNSDFFDSLSFDQQVFVLAHETCHIAFKHFARSQDKPEKDIERKYQIYCEKVTDENLRKIERIRLHQKYNRIWNIATDACINAFLKKEGLEVPEGVIDKKTGQPMKFVNIEDGLYRSAEIIYDALVKKEEEKDSTKTEQDSHQNSEIGGGLDNVDVDGYQGIDSHDSWANEPEQTKKETEQPTNKNESKSKKSKSLIDKIKKLFNGDKKEEPKKKESDNTKDEAPNNNQPAPEISTDEAKVFKANEAECNKLAKNSLSESISKITEEANCSHIKVPKPILSWKQLLISSIEEEVEKWGYRRASRSMPNARTEDRTEDDRATTEIILDTSNSISDELLRGFLFQLVPLFKETDIKVGCFSGYFHGFTELRSIKQIQEFTAIRDGRGTNFEAAATAFTQDKGYKKINKIVFTDGELDGYVSHIQRTKVDGIMWIVFGNKMNFNPLSGKIIRVSEDHLSQMLSVSQINDETPKLRR